MASMLCRARAAVVAVAIAILLVGIAPSAVLAHAELVSSTPADGAELTSPPTEIRLVFSEAPRLDELSVRLFDRRGTEVGLGNPATGPLATTVIVPIPTALRPGPYTVVWSVVSAEDEHPEANQFVFGVGEPPGAPSVTADDLPGIAGNALLPASTLLAILGLTLMLGAGAQAGFFGLDRRRVASLGLVGAGISASALVVKVLGTPRAAAMISDGSTGIDPADLARVGLIAAFAMLTLASARASPERTRRCSRPSPSSDAAPSVPRPRQVRGGLRPSRSARCPPSTARGHGLIGMRERAVLLGGTLDAKRHDGAFRVRARIPIGWDPA